MSFAPNFKDVNVHPCPVHELLTLEGRLFVESCDVTITEHVDRHEAMAYVAVVLAGDELELAS